MLRVSVCISVGNIFKGEPESGGKLEIEGE